MFRGQIGTGRPSFSQKSPITESTPGFHRTSLLMSGIIEMS